jgi:hypothetical protein
LKLLRDTIAADRYPLSPRVRSLRAILDKLDPPADPNKIDLRRPHGTRRMAGMDEHDWHRRVEAVREQVETASIGIIIGASLMVFTPVSVTQALGLGNERAAGLKVALVAAAVWLAFRIMRIK